MKNELTLQLIDTHAGGDVSRIVTGGVDPLPGATVRQQMEYLRDDADGLRRLLLEEPYGIPEMSVDLIVPPSHPDASVGYIIMEVMGYAIYSGSNTICTATAVLESGLVPKELDLAPLLEEAKKQLHEEADYEREGAEMERFASLLEGDDRYVVPRRDDEFTTPNVLAMSFIEGIKTSKTTTGKHHYRWFHLSSFSIKTDWWKH